MSSELHRIDTAPSVGESFEEVVLPHLDAAYRLARWRMGNEHDAEEVVQEASLRALRYFRTFTGGNGRAWFLRIVRNTCWGWRGHRRQAPTESFDEERHSSARVASDPETLLLQTDDISLIERAIARLPDRSRELLVLRELKGLSYRELAQAMGIPIGTVMSSLSRARQAFRGAVNSELNQSGTPQRADVAGQRSDELPMGRVARKKRTGDKRWKRLRFPQRSRQGPVMREGGSNGEKSGGDSIRPGDCWSGRCA